MRIRIPQHQGDPLANIFEFFHTFCIFFIPVGPLAVVGLYEIIFKGYRDPETVKMTVIAWILLIIIILARWYMLRQGYRSDFIYDWILSRKEKKLAKQPLTVKESLSASSPQAPSAAVPKTQKTETLSAASKKELLQRLEYYKMLLDSGTIDQEEYTKAVMDILVQLKQ